MCTSWHTDRSLSCFPVLTNIFPVLSRHFQFYSVIFNRNNKQFKTHVIMEKKEEKKMQLDEQLMDNVNGGANYVSQQNRPTSSHTPC